MEIRNPDLEVQRRAMSKLNFLVGKWTGEARMLRPGGQSVDLQQTEDAQYKLNDLVLIIEGLGRRASDGQPVLQALGLISYDDATSKYHFRAFNDGRFLHTEATLLETGQGLTWEFALGEIATSSILRINENGEWTEHHQIRIGGGAAKPLMDVTVRRTK